MAICSACSEERPNSFFLDSFYLEFRARPLIRALFQSLVQQDEAVLFPVQALDPVSPPSAEQKKRVGKWIQFKLLLDEPRQAIYAFTQICVATGNVDFICTGEAVPRHNRDKYPDWRFQYAALRNVPQRCVIPVSVPEVLQT